jgi:hypothetical protein
LMGRGIFEKSTPWPEYIPLTTGVLGYCYHWRPKKTKKRLEKSVMVKYKFLHSQKNCGPFCIQNAF